MARMDLKESGDIGHSLRGHKEIVGEPGLQGLVGQPGMPGLEGLQGFLGIPGPKSYRGEPGISAGSKKGQPNKPGLPGFDGQVGPKGLKGDSGLAGFDGLPGPRGERGDTDESGLRLPGPEGPQHRDTGADDGGQSLISFGSCLEEFGVRPFIECRGFGSCNYFTTSYWLTTIHDENMFRKPLQQTLKADHTSRVSRCVVCLRRWVIEVLKPFMSNERAPNNWGVALPAPPPPPRNLPDYESSKIPPSFFEVEMGQPPNVTKQEAIALIGKYMEHFRTNKFPEYSSAVWRSMSQDTGGRWKSRSVYNHVRENKRGDLVEARQNLSIMIPAPGKNIDIIDDIESVIDKSCVNESESDDQSVYQDDDHDEDGSEWFDLKLTRVEWEEIKPDNTCVRTKKALKPHVWGNVIAKAFWRRYNFPCAFVFKWSYVSQQSDDKENESYFLKIKGGASCKNYFFGIFFLWFEKFMYYLKNIFPKFQSLNQILKVPKKSLK